MCVSLFYVIVTGLTGPGDKPGDCLYCQSTLGPYFDAGCAGLPLTLLGAPVNIGVSGALKDAELRFEGEGLILTLPLTLPKPRFTPVSLLRVCLGRLMTLYDMPPYLHARTHARTHARKHACMHANLHHALCQRCLRRPNTCQKRLLHGQKRSIMCGLLRIC